MTFTFTMDAFPGKTKNNPNKKVLCEINVLEEAYDPEDGISDSIIATGSSADGVATIKVNTRDSGLTYKYKTATSTISDNVKVGDDTSTSPASTYTNAITFTDNVFAFEPDDGHKYIKIIAIDSDDKVAAISNVCQFDE